MILIDSSVWIDHFRKPEVRLSDLLIDGQAMTHPFVVGEIALGSVAERRQIVETMLQLPTAAVAGESEVLWQVERRRLHGRGIGYIDAHLLTSAQLEAAQLWTRDKRLRAVAEELGLQDANLT